MQLPASTDWARGTPEIDMQNDEKEIRELVKSWFDATRKGDYETVLDLMTEDVVFLVPGQAPFGKSAFAETSKQHTGSAIQFDARSEIHEIRVLGDWAFMLTLLSVTTTLPDQDRPVVRNGHTLSVLHKQAGKWRIARDANLLVKQGD